MELPPKHLHLQSARAGQWHTATRLATWQSLKTTALAPSERLIGQRLMPEKKVLSMKLWPRTYSVRRRSRISLSGLRPCITHQTLSFWLSDLTTTRSTFLKQESIRRSSTAPVTVPSSPVSTGRKTQDGSDPTAAPTSSSSSTSRRRKTQEIHPAPPTPLALNGLTRPTSSAGT